MLAPAMAIGNDAWDTLQARFREPPADCRPHTRWWWMGNAATKENLTWELKQMVAQGSGGVEQINRVSGLKGPPPIPESLVPQLGRGITSAGSRIPIGFQPLPASGLLGPVKVLPAARVRVPVE